MVLYCEPGRGNLVVVYRICDVAGGGITEGLLGDGGKIEPPPCVGKE